MLRRTLGKPRHVALALALAAGSTFAAGPAFNYPAHAAFLNCPTYQSYDRARLDANVSFDGAQASWQLRTLAAPDYQDGGHANTTLWFGTDGNTAQTWVEIGVTQGWKGANNYKYYYAHRYWSGSSYLYFDYLVTINPVLNHYASFRIYKSGTSIVARVTDKNNGAVANYPLSHHSAPYDQWWIGAEYTCPETNGSKVYKTYVFDNVFRRASDGLWLDASSGTLEASGVSGAGEAWCSYPITFRFWVKSPTTTGCN